MADKLRKIGISGGTFDPIHYGHLIVAEIIREKFQLEKVIFIPTGLPPHKNSAGVTNAEHRYNMVKDAIQTNPYFEVSRIEIERRGITYAVDTLTELRGIYGPDTDLFYIIGADVVRDITTWKNFKEVFPMCNFIAVLRPEHKIADFNNTIEYLKSTYMAKIHTSDIPLIDISSTYVRERVKNNKSIKYLVPESVEAYANCNGLYKK